MFPSNYPPLVQVGPPVPALIPVIVPLVVPMVVPVAPFMPVQPEAAASPSSVVIEPDVNQIDFTNCRKHLIGLLLGKENYAGSIEKTLIHDLAKTITTTGAEKTIATLLNDIEDGDTYANLVACCHNLFILLDKYEIAGREEIHPLLVKQLCELSTPHPKNSIELIGLLLTQIPSKLLQSVLLLSTTFFLRDRAIFDITSPLEVIGSASQQQGKLRFEQEGIAFILPDTIPLALEKIKEEVLDSYMLNDLEIHALCNLTGFYFRDAHSKPNYNNALDYDIATQAMLQAIAPSIFKFLEAKHYPFLQAIGFSFLIQLAESNNDFQRLLPAFLKILPTLLATRSLKNYRSALFEHFIHHAKKALNLSEEPLNAHHPLTLLRQELAKNSQNSAFILCLFCAAFSQSQDPTCTLVVRKVFKELLRHLPQDQCYHLGHKLMQAYAKANAHLPAMKIMQEVARCENIPNKIAEKLFIALHTEINSTYADCPLALSLMTEITLDILEEASEIDIPLAAICRQLADAHEKVHNDETSEIFSAIIPSSFSETAPPLLPKCLPPIELLLQPEEASEPVCQSLTVPPNHFENAKSALASESPLEAYQWLSSGLKNNAEIPSKQILEMVTECAAKLVKAQETTKALELLKELDAYPNFLPEQQGKVWIAVIEQTLESKNWALTAALLKLKAEFFKDKGLLQPLASAAAALCQHYCSRRKSQNLISFLIKNYELSNNHFWTEICRQVERKPSVNKALIGNFTVYYRSQTDKQHLQAPALSLLSAASSNLDIADETYILLQELLRHAGDKTKLLDISLNICQRLFEKNANSKAVRIWKLIVKSHSAESLPDLPYNWNRTLSGKKIFSMLNICADLTLPPASKLQLALAVGKYVLITPLKTLSAKHCHTLEKHAPFLLDTLLNEGNACEPLLIQLTEKLESINTTSAVQWKSVHSHLFETVERTDILFLRASTLEDPAKKHKALALLLDKLKHAALSEAQQKILFECCKQLKNASEDKTAYKILKLISKNKISVDQHQLALAWFSLMKANAYNNSLLAASILKTQRALFCLFPDINDELTKVSNAILKNAFLSKQHASQSTALNLLDTHFPLSAAFWNPILASETLQDHVRQALITRLIKAGMLDSTSELMCDLYLNEFEALGTFYILLLSHPFNTENTQLYFNTALDLQSFYRPDSLHSDVTKTKAYQCQLERSLQFFELKLPQAELVQAFFIILTHRNNLLASLDTVESKLDSEMEFQRILLTQAKPEQLLYLALNGFKQFKILLFKKRLLDPPKGIIEIDNNYLLTHCGLLAKAMRHYKELHTAGCTDQNLDIIKNEFKNIFGSLYSTYTKKMGSILAGKQGLDHGKLQAVRLFFKRYFDPCAVIDFFMLLDADLGYTVLVTEAAKVLFERYKEKRYVSREKMRFYYTAMLEYLQNSGNIETAIAFARHTDMKLIASPKEHKEWINQLYQKKFKHIREAAKDEQPEARSTATELPLPLPLPLPTTTTTTTTTSNNRGRGRGRGRGRK